MKKIELAMDEFMIFCDSKGLSKKTMASYEQTLRLFVKYLKEEHNIKDVTKVTDMIIRQYINCIKVRGKYTVATDEKGSKFNRPENRSDLGKEVSPQTINNYLRNIKVFFNFMLEQGYIKKDVFKNIKFLKTDRAPKDFITDDQFSNMLRNMDNSKYHEYRDSIIIQLLLDTGMRVGECLAIKTENLDMNERSILLPALNTKGKKSRYVFFSLEMQKELRRWLKYKDRTNESEILFCSTKGGQLEIATFEKKIKSYGERVGLKNVHPHQLRNNFARRFLINGGSVFILSKILGHSSVQVTEAAYLDLDDNDLRRGYQKYSPLSHIKGRK